MKIDFVKSFVAVAISTLLAYACYEICAYENVQWVITIGCFLTIAIPFVFAIGVSVKEERIALNLNILSWTFVIIEFLSNTCFVFFDFSIPTYVILNGIILLIYLLVYNTIVKRFDSTL